MKAQYTPGPWKTVVYPEEGWIDIEAPDGTCIIGDLGIRNDEYLEANANLIAAAPDLLEALEDMVRIFDRGLPSECIGRRTCDNAIKVIAKAKGEA